MEKATEIKLMGLAKGLGMIPKDNGDTWQGTIRQLYDLANAIAQDQKVIQHRPWLTDQELLDISDQMPEQEKKIECKEDGEEFVMDLGPFITAYGRKVATIQTEKILQTLEGYLQEEEDLDELFQELRKKLLLGDK